MTTAGSLRVLDQRALTVRGRALLVSGLLIGAVLLAIAARRPAGDGEPLDPDSAGRLGAKALVILLREGGGDVRVSAKAPDPWQATALVLRDTFDQPRRDEMTAWVRSGGTLVVTDPRSRLGMVEPFLPPVSGSSGVENVHGPCTALPALAQIGSVDASRSLVYSRGGRATGAVGCFGTKDGDFLVATPLGAGTVVALGGAGLWINDNLDHSGNAGLAVALLAPQRGTRLQIVSDFADDAPSTGSRGQAGRGVIDVLPAGVKVAAWQLVLAFGVAVLWRARRLGRPVREVQPTEVPASELVVAAGNVHQLGGHRRRAATVLATRARRRVADRFGVPRATSPDDLAVLVGARTGMDLDEVRAALSTSVPADDAALVRMAGAADAVERTVSGRPTNEGDDTT